LALIAFHPSSFAETANLALGKVAIQSSTSDDSAPASLAVDGALGHFTQTDFETAPWWQVDLESPHSVDSVTLWNRTDCCKDQLSNFHVDFLDNNDNIIATYDHPGSVGERVIIPLAAEGVRTVRVQLYAAGELSLREVQVWKPLNTVKARQEYAVANMESRRANNIIRAARGEPINQHDLDNQIATINDFKNGKKDFTIPFLVRLMYLNETYEDKILAPLLTLDYWITQGDLINSYNSENHMIQWISSYHLVLQKIRERGDVWNNQQDPERMLFRLNHYLDLKLKYGFHEFFSPTYYRMTLRGLTNLADFSSDPVIKDKAARAILRLVQEWMYVINDEGNKLSTAGRSYDGSGSTEGGGSEFTWMVTGIGKMNGGAGSVASFMLTSTVDYESIEFKESRYVKLEVGYDGAERLSVHAGLDQYDRALFQMTSGGYFTKYTSIDTVRFARHYGIHQREELKDLAFLANIPEVFDVLYAPGAAVGDAYSDGSWLHANLHIFKDGGVVLSSAQNHHSGKMGYQTIPWAAAVGDLSVFTGSGDVESANSKNSHFPYVKQDENVALIAYHPHALIYANKRDKSVTLMWPGEKFDEQAFDGQWAMGRRGDDFIAVYRDDTVQLDNGNFWSNRNKGRQLWIAVVGNERTHGSFANFKDVIANASINQSVSYNFLRTKSVYDTSVTVDGKKLSNRSSSGSLGFLFLMLLFFMVFRRFFKKQILALLQPRANGASDAAVIGGR